MTAVQEATSMRPEPFDGEVMPYGGLTNENHLAAECPDEFRAQTGVLYERAKSIFANGVHGEADLDHVRGHIEGLRNSFVLPGEIVKIAIIAWMVSVAPEIPTM